MEVDPNFYSLLRTLGVDDPWVPPKTWESIPSESGDNPCASGEPQDSIYESSSISEPNLVHIIINAMQGLGSSILDICKISDMFSACPADRTSHRVPTLWCRSLSANALGNLLKFISHSGIVVYLLKKFIDFYLSVSFVQPNGDKGVRSTTTEAANLSDLLRPPSNGKVGDIDEIWMHPPYSLINQAFAAAVKKVLQGYFGALNTLQASVKLRRSVSTFEKSSNIFAGSCGLKSMCQSGISILEVVLHTNELRAQIELLGNICLPWFSDLALPREALTAETNLEFRNFPRGVDLLTHLYGQLHDADPIHQPLLRLLFVESCKPYCGFIKCWIFRGSINDPYKEFLVQTSSISNIASEYSNDDFITEEQVGISIPCFLKDVRLPLVRAGLQLQVLVKFVSLFSLARVGGTCTHYNLANIEEILPCWAEVSTDFDFLSNSLTFSKQRIEALIHQRRNMYQVMLEKLEVFFAKSHVKYERMNHMVIPFGNTPNLIGERSPSIPVVLHSDDNYNFSGATDEIGAAKLDTIQKDADASYTSDESSLDLQLFHSSETSYTSEEETDLEYFVNSGHNASEPDSLMHSNLLSCYTSNILCPNSIESGRLCSSIAPSYGKFKQQSLDTVAGIDHEDTRMNDIFVSTVVVDGKPTGTPLVTDEGYNSAKCCLVDRTSNPSYDFMNYRNSNQEHFSENSSLVTDDIPQLLENEKPISDKVFSTFHLKLDGDRRFELLNAQNEPHSWINFSSFNTDVLDDLTANPNLARVSLLGNMDRTKARSFTRRKLLHCPYFDFSSVVDPCNYWRSMLTNTDDALQVEPSKIVNSELAVDSNEMLDFTKKNSEKQPDSCPTRPSDELRETHIGDVRVCTGGAAWVSSLKYPKEDIDICADDKFHNSMEFEMPLDVVIDKCILQDILLQYKYISSVTIKLLEEGFDFYGHLLALRRYHFMELADWADSFIISVRKQKWACIEPQKKITEIQGLLELALHRSSCEADQYKERLFVYMDKRNSVPLPTSSAGPDVFDFMLLGYKVDWPITIIVTPAALKTYAEIFRYLSDVRLAAFSLTEAWCHLKALTRSLFVVQESKIQEVDLHILIKLRQQMNHFLSSLQQYLHSQLSNVSWCQFQHSLKNKVKDMLDLESVHMSYLTRALHICFLSDETKPVAAVIKNILQCALDFGLCLAGGRLCPGSDKAETFNWRSHINLSEVMMIKTTFETNIKDLHVLYCKSSKHVDFSLSCFWDYLNHNEYFSNVLNKDMGCLYVRKRIHVESVTILFSLSELRADLAWLNQFSANEVHWLLKGRFNFIANYSKEAKRCMGSSPGN